MICSSLTLLFLMFTILPVDGLHFLYAGTAGGGQVTMVRGPASSQSYRPALKRQVLSGTGSPFLSVYCFVVPLF